MPAGQSSIHLDPDTINAILAQFVNRPGGAQVVFHDGRFSIRAGGLTLAVDRIQIGPQGIDIDIAALRLQ